MTVTVFRLNGVDYSDVPRAVVDALMVAVSRLADVGALIAHARKDIPALIAEVKRLRHIAEFAISQVLSR